MKIDVSGSIEWLYDWQLQCDERRRSALGCDWMYETPAADGQTASLADFVKQADAHYAAAHPGRTWRSPSS